MKNKLSKMFTFRWKSSIREEGVTKQTALLFFFFFLLVSRGQVFLHRVEIILAESGRRHGIGSGVSCSILKRTVF